MQKFAVPMITVGKTQTVQINDILEFFMPLALAKSQTEFTNTLSALIEENSGFKAFIEKLFTGSKQAVFYSKLAEGKILPTNARLIFERLFSATQRGAGSNLAGVPIVRLTTNKYGIFPKSDPEFDTVFNGAGGDSFRLSPLNLNIGLPFSNQMKEITIKVAQRIAQFATQMEKINVDSADVDDITNEVLRQFEMIYALSKAETNYGREIIQMDYFLLPPAFVRKNILQEGVVSDAAMKNLYLRAKEKRGGYKLTIFDISGGAGGVGLSELVALLRLNKASGHFEAYIASALASFKSQNGKNPDRIIIVPRTADLTILSVEYAPLKKRLEEMGYQTHIVTMENFQGLPNTIEDIDGRCFDLSDGQSTLVMKRFTYLHEGTEMFPGKVTRGLIPSVELTGKNCTIFPSPMSRIVASDKRVNLRLLNMMQEELSLDGLAVIPTMFTTTAVQSAQSISHFLASVSEEWPEVNYLGGVLKTFDKVPGRAGKAGEIVSAYPLPSAPFSEEQIEVFVVPLLNKLADAGVNEIVVMPNVMTLISDGHQLVPKTEIKMMAFLQE